MVIGGRGACRASYQSRKQDDSDEATRVADQTSDLARYDTAKQRSAWHCDVWGPALMSEIRPHGDETRVALAKLGKFIIINIIIIIIMLLLF